MSGDRQDRPAPPPGWKPMRAGPFPEMIGPLLRRVPAEGEAAPGPGEGRRYALATGAGHGNLVGSLHGGVAAALIDQAMAVEAWEIAGRRPVVTVQMELRWLEALRPGDFVEAEARLTRRAGSILFMEATAGAEGRLALKASAVMKIVRDKTDEGEGRR